MRAGYLIAPGKIEVRDDAVPAAEPGGVVVRVRVALTDGTDLKAFRRGHPQMPMPTRFGHEFSGDVAAAGEGVTCVCRLASAIACAYTPRRVGEVLLVRARPARNCANTVMGDEDLGAYAEYVAVPPHIVAAQSPSSSRPGCLLRGRRLPRTARLRRALAARSSRRRPTSRVAGHRRRRLRHPPRAGGAAVARGPAGAPDRDGRPRADGRRERGGASSRCSTPADARSTRRSTTSGAGATGRGAERGGRVHRDVRDAWEAAPSLVARGGTASLFGGLPSGRASRSTPRACITTGSASSRRFTSRRARCARRSSCSRRRRSTSRR